VTQKLRTQASMCLVLCCTGVASGSLAHGVACAAPSRGVHALRRGRAACAGRLYGVDGVACVRCTASVVPYLMRRHVSLSDTSVYKARPDVRPHAPNRRLRRASHSPLALRVGRFGAATNSSLTRPPSSVPPPAAGASDTDGIHKHITAPSHACALAHRRRAREPRGFCGAGAPAASPHVLNEATEPSKYIISRTRRRAGGISASPPPAAADRGVAAPPRDYGRYPAAGWDAGGAARVGQSSGSGGAGAADGYRGGHAAGGRRDWDAGGGSDKRLENVSGPGVYDRQVLASPPRQEPYPSHGAALAGGATPHYSSAC
jgi:hypothetical protein